MGFGNFIKKFFYGDGDTIAPQKTENELLFEKFMNDVISRNSTYFNSLAPERKHHINILCDNVPFYDMVDFFYKKNKDINIRNYSCYDRWHNVDVEFDDVSITEHNFIYGQYYFVLSFSNMRTFYHSVSMDLCKKLFPENEFVDMDEYNKYEPDLKRYGFKLDYRNGRIFLLHPKEESSKNEECVSYPCPYCGGTHAIIKRCYDATEHGISGFYVMCDKCGLQSAKAQNSTEAVQKWDELGKKSYDC